MAREDLTGAEVDDGDLTLVDDGQDPSTGMGGADSEVVQAALIDNGAPGGIRTPDPLIRSQML